MRKQTYLRYRRILELVKALLIDLLYFLYLILILLQLIGRI
jgi:hypothetical protein